MKIMISQPTTGKTKKQINNEKKKLKEKLENEGNEVIEVTVTEIVPENSKEPLYYLSKLIETMSKVDAIVFMPGWELEKECRVLHKIAKLYEIFIKEL